MEDDEDMFGADYFPINPDEEEMLRVGEIDFEEDRVEIEEKVTEVVPEVVREVVKVVSPPPPPPPVVEFPIAADIFPLTQPPHSADFFTVTSSLGNRVYLAARESEPVAGDRIVQFLEKPFPDLLRLAQECTQARDAELTRWMESKGAAGKSLDSRTTRQFVDKYKPARFVDLLSDDSANKNFMLWLSEWKKQISHPFAGGITISEPPKLDLAQPVSKRPPPETKSWNRDRQESGGNGYGGNGKWSKLGVGMKEAEAQAVEVVRVPNRKVLLLGGPPGVGKSVLVDVCCRHFKMHVVESNAADERGKAAMAKVITDVCGNRSVLDAASPQVLLIEEVDGDECSAADVLVEMLRSHPELIKRPIICVCSDVYKKSLRSLRELATVVSLAPPRPLRLTEKLKQICAIEGISIESLALDRLVQLCDSDIRSCLNQLQALSCQAMEERLTVADVARLCTEGGSVKDCQKSELELLQLIFEPKRARPPNYPELLRLGLSGALSASMSDLFAHCMVTVGFTDLNFRHMLRLSQLLPMGGSLCMQYAAWFCPAVGKPRIDLFGARKLIGSRFQARADLDSVLHALAKSGLHSARASRFVMASRQAFGLYGARLLLTLLQPDHNAVWVKKANVCHPEVERIAKIFAEFGLELVKEEMTGEFQLRPNLRLFADLPVCDRQMAEVLAVEAKVQLLKMHAAADGSAQLISKGFKRSIAPIVEEIKKPRMNLSEWAGGQPEGGPETDIANNVKMHAFPFEFRFSEGHTNAVRRVLRLRDFQPKHI